MPHPLAFDYSAPGLLASSFGALLLVALLYMELKRGRNHEVKTSGFFELLDELELVPTRAFCALSTNEVALSSDVGRLSVDEVLRRMSGNARVLCQLAAIDGATESAEECAFAQRLRKQGNWLRLCIGLFNCMAPVALRTQIVEPCLKYIERSYWLIVSGLDAFYRSHRSLRRSAAVAAAFNVQYGAAA